MKGKIFNRKTLLLSSLLHQLINYLNLKQDFSNSIQKNDNKKNFY
ncbi:hypothetical protein CLV48_10910 [Cecembia rubra]|uniref:Uncharacterized protein n=1 Tax=Cecembia rubra TaxID=1485585 RepID=A0A2P8DZ92_9BACT|nr:hypothetical protein CLV48_10910 [Cecembia rubra]